MAERRGGGGVEGSREQALYQPPLEPGPKLRSWGQELLHFLVICVLLAGAWFLLGLGFKP